MRNRPRNERATVQTVDALVDEMAWIGRQRLSKRYREAVVMARLLRRMSWSAQARDRLRPAFEALVKSVGGVKGNRNFTTGERSHFHATRDALKYRGQSNGLEIARQDIPTTPLG